MSMYATLIFIKYTSYLACSGYIITMKAKERVGLYRCTTILVEAIPYTRKSGEGRREKREALVVALWVCSLFFPFFVFYFWVCNFSGQFFVMVWNLGLEISVLMFKDWTLKSQNCLHQNKLLKLGDIPRHVAMQCKWAPFFSCHACSLKQAAESIFGNIKA